ncbi:glycoside hydrolase family 3 protein [Rheinheimera oceanensis]|uniref:glycoside hydrolase family 3 protein n=1 Tax=Rheinheimera oceanensis TaxID=2817449 RepID=UPI001BFD9116|nr:exo 1,3/1,4-beta-D-glucan glucohydrolase [Rheinheimera oceanensis]
MQQSKRYQGSGQLSAILTLALACSLALVGCAGQAPDGSSQAAEKPQIQPQNWPLQSAPIARNQQIEDKINALLRQMTPEQKVGQIIQADIASVTPQQARDYYLGSVLNGGNSAPGRDNRVGAAAWLQLADAFWQASTDTSDGRPYIPLIWGTDAVHGHSNVKGATIFPHNIGLGAMREPQLLHAIGRATAIEMQVTGLDWTFAPTIAVARDDRWGRTYESYSEDPALVASYAPYILQGIQGTPGAADFLRAEHMLATVKHFLGDGGTVGGKDQGDNIDTEAQLRDIHAPPYYSAIKAGARVVMASYNSWHGDKMHGFAPMLTDVLVHRMGFDGFVVGDWNGHGQITGCTPTDCAASVIAGLDMYMAPDSWQALYANTLAQVKDGRLPMARLDEAVLRILRIKAEMGLFEQVKPSERPLAGRYELLGNAQHRALAREAARKSLVLLKNNQQLLPLNTTGRVLVAGDGADNIGKQSGGWTLSWQGSGNANSDFPNGESVYAGILQTVTAGGGSVELSENGRYSQRPDVAIVVFGEEPYAEFIGDRSHLAFDDNRGLQILTQLKSQGIPTVAVFLSGRPLWVNPELNQSDAFVAAFLPGSEGGAVADVLFRSPAGEVQHDFQGKLSFSWPDNAKGEPLNVGDAGYKPLFAYGYGLNYGDNTTVGQLHEEAGISADQMLNASRYLHAGKAVTPWQLQLLDQGQITRVTDALHTSALGAITATATDRLQQEDSVTLSFVQPGTVLLTHADGVVLDLARQSNGDMALELEYQVLALSNSNTTLGMQCGDNCSANIDISGQLAQMQGQGWQSMKIALRCFSEADSAFDISKVTRPMVLQAGAGLVLQLANVRLAQNEGNATCGN